MKQQLPRLLGRGSSLEGDPMKALCKKALHACALSTILLLTVTANADMSGLPSALQTNGCGSTFSSKWVPDKLADCDFRAACDEHDRCYGKCLEGGVLAGTERCLDPQNVKDTRRLQCDKNLQEDIKKHNNGSCKGWAWLYGSVVKMAGGGSFNGMEPALVRSVIETSNSPEVAYARIKEIERIARSGLVDKKSLAIDPSGEITFETLKPTMETPGIKDTKFVIPKDMKGISLDKRSISTGGQSNR